MKKDSHRNQCQPLSMVQIGLFAAVLAVLSQISIPLPTGIPITLQTFAVALAAYTLGWKKGVASVGICRIYRRHREICGCYRGISLGISAHGAVMWNCGGILDKENWQVARCYLCAAEHCRISGLSCCRVGAVCVGVGVVDAASFFAGVCAVSGKGCVFVDCCFWVGDDGTPGSGWAEIVRYCPNVGWSK